MVNVQREIEGILSTTEDVIMCLRQSHMSAFTPSFVVITDANVITVHFSFWHYYTGIRLFSTTYKTIVSYRFITGATIKKGNFLSTLEIKTKDIKHSEKKGVESSVIIDGLYTQHAERIAKLIDLIIITYLFPSPVQDPEKVSVQRAIDICRETKKKLVWLGFEEKDSVAAMLSIPSEMIEATTLSKLLSLPGQELARYQDRVIMGYTTNSTTVTAKVLQLEAQLNCRIVDGGFINNIPHGRTFMRRSVPLHVKHANLKPLPNRQAYPK